MSEIIKFDVNNPISLEYSDHVKEEYQDEHYPDTKVCVSEVGLTDTINVSNDKILDDIKTDLPSEVDDTVSNNVKIEDAEICHADIQIEFRNELLFCNHCHEVYQDYCTKCRVLLHILNDRPCHNTYNRTRELPKYMLEARELIGYLGIFSLKVIPENVRFGPFTGLNSTGLPFRIKGGRFVVSNEKLVHLNWMQCINPARNIDHQNLFPFQYDDKLYYCSTRRILEGEELLVYFGEECEENLLKNVEMDFVPIVKKDIENVFACTFCCLGFSSKEYLAEHKSVCHSQTKEMFSVEELTQCPFCKIYLEAKEYFEHHLDYCYDTNDRYFVVPTPDVHELIVEKRLSERREAKRRNRGIYKCTRCNFRTIYSADLRHHTNEHCEVKMYKCGICPRRYKAKESLKAHVAKFHAGNEGTNVQEYSTRDYFKANVNKNVKKEGPPHLDDGESKCNFQTRDKYHLKPLIKIKHSNRGKYKCPNCEFKTYYRHYLGTHMKIKHLKHKDYRCAECEFKTNIKSNLQVHIKAKHVEINYKCVECEFKTNYQSSLTAHIKAKHLEEKSYKCTECEYEGNYKSNLERHVKVKHLIPNDYKCTECEYKTNYKSSLTAHVKARHLEEKAYKCMECEYKTNIEAHLKIHVKRKHLRQKDYKCTECEFKTNIKSSLQVHIKAKHVEIDYKCVECEFKTNYKSSLTAHIKAKHLEEKSYKCTECAYEANYKSNLERHVKAKHLKPNDYKCTECEYKTNYKSSLTAHIKAKHLKQSEYKCLECDFETNFKYSLEAHIKAKHLKQKDCKQQI